MDTDFIKHIAESVEEKYKSEKNVFGYEGWTHHLLIVVKYAKILADILDADREVVELAAWLHDVASVTDIDLYKDHHIHGASIAEEMLRVKGYSEEKIEKVKDCIIQHRGSVVLERTSKESICVASADAMSHIDQVPSLLHLAYCKKKLDVTEGTQWVRSKIVRSWNKLCPEAKEIIREKYNSALQILETSEMSTSQNGNILL